MRPIRSGAAIRKPRLLLAIVGIMLVRPEAPDRPGAVLSVADARGTQGILGEIRRSEYRFTTTADGALWAPNRSQGIVSRATEAGLRLLPRRATTGAGWSDRSGAWEVGLRLDRF